MINIPVWSWKLTFDRTKYWFGSWITPTVKAHKSFVTNTEPQQRNLDCKTTSLIDYSSVTVGELPWSVSAQLQTEYRMKALLQGSDQGYDMHARSPCVLNVMLRRFFWFFLSTARKTDSLLTVITDKTTGKMSKNSVSFILFYSICVLKCAASNPPSVEKLKPLANW